MLERYGELLVDAAPRIAGLFVVGALLAVVGRRRVIAPLMVLLGVVAGVVLAIERASVCDDAFVSFRYARNLLEGHGLVWNIGERVEGYTNFLWVMLTAAVSGVIGLELPLVAVALCLISFVAVILLVWRHSRSGVAALLFALSATALDYATTGMETMFGAALVLGGALLLCDKERSVAWGGALFALAVLTRPDHLLFWGAGGLVVLLGGQRRPRDLAVYAATLVPVLVHAAWRFGYYGELLPNTFHAKSASTAYFSQGGIYTLAFLLGAHLWVIIPLALSGLRRSARPFAVFAGASLPIWHAYVVWVGGDFMFGRFLLVLLPIWLVLAAKGAKGPLSNGLLLATLGGVSIIGPEVHRWHITDETRVYPVTQWHPQLVIDHHNWRTGVRLGELFDEDYRPVVATSGIGMVGYYSRLEVIDLLGLTDARIARRPVEERGMVGHEKVPRAGYVLRKRGAVIGRWQGLFPQPRWRPVTRLDMGLELDEQWRAFCYEPELVAYVEAHPEMSLRDFTEIIDRWLTRGPWRPAPITASSDVAFFDAYYFACNDDPERKEAVERRLRERTGQ